MLIFSASLCLVYLQLFMGVRAVTPVKLSNVLGLSHSSKEHRDPSFELLSQHKTGHDAPGCAKAGTTSSHLNLGEHST